MTPALVPVRLDISRTTGEGYALRLRFEATIEGPCMRCLEPAAPSISRSDAREVVDSPGETDELDSPYVEAEVLELAAWARDALALALPATILCRADCAGLCAVCGANLNDGRARPRSRARARPALGQAGRAAASSADAAAFRVAVRAGYT